MVGEIAAALTSLKAAGDIAKAMMDIRDASTFQSKAVDLQRQILSAQESALAANERQTALVERISALEKEVAQLKEWDTEKKTYELYEVGPGAFAYLRKLDANIAEQPHWLCTTCFQNSKGMPLQFWNQLQRDHLYKCFSCETIVRVPYDVSPLEIQNRRELARTTS